MKNKEDEQSNKTLNALDATVKQIRESIKDILAPEDISFKKATAPDSSVLEKAAGIDGSSNHANFMDDAQTCWIHMSKARGSSLCSICSGRSNIFFNNSKILVNVDSCESIIKSCQQFFIKLKEFTKDYQSLITIVDKTMSNTTQNSTLTVLHLDMIKYSPPADLIDLFVNYDKAEENDKPSLAAQICGRILNLRQNTIFSYISKLVNEENETSQAYRDMSKTALQLRENCRDSGRRYDRNGQISRYVDYRSNYKPHSEDKNKWKTGYGYGYSLNWAKSRSLIGSNKKGSTKGCGVNRGDTKAEKKDTDVLDDVSEIENNEIYFSDSTVLMRKSDNMFDSYDGAKGTTLDQLSVGSSETIDFKIAFP